MKQFLLSLTFSTLLFGTINAQLISVDPPLYDAHFDAVELNGATDIEVHASVTNNTANAINLKWQREVPESCPEGWKTLICDNVQCYAASTSTNFNPPALEAPFTLAPGETYPEFLLHIRPAFAAGCCKVNVHFSTVENPTQILATIEYDIRINDPQCSLSSTDEISVLDALNAFPNPNTGVFSISESPLVKKVVVTDVLGRQLRSFAHSTGNLYDISDAPDGLYLVSMLDANGDLLKTVRMTKQDLRP